MKHLEAVGLLSDLKSRAMETQARLRLLEHLDHCEECAGWADTYNWFATALGESTRADHPTTDQLARYSVDINLVSGPERQHLENHLAGCRRCAKEVDLTQAAVSGSGLKTRLLQFKPRLADSWSPMVRGALAASVVFALLSAIFIYQLQESAQVAQKLSGGSLAGIQVIEAVESISADGTTIESGGDITFRAGETVVLGNGFSILQNATFTAEITQAQSKRSVMELEKTPSHS